MDVNAPNYVNPIPLWKTIVIASISSSIQFGGALLALMLPYVQHLGVPHSWASIIMLCGPISLLIIQPTVGYASDKCTSPFWKRKPFIIAGIASMVTAAFFISFSLEAGVYLGDSVNAPTKPKSVAIFITGFMFLDGGMNLAQGPVRALLADLSVGDHRRMRLANAIFSFFMAVGNILGYAVSSNGELYKYLPSTHNEVCDPFCANLKCCFLIAVILLLSVTTFSLTLVREPDTDASQPINQESLFVQLKTAISRLDKPIWILYLVTALTWLAWFPFILYNTDWVGKEVYGGDVEGTTRQQELYYAGVHSGSLGLMLTATSLGIMSLFVDPLSMLLGGARKLLGVGNILLGFALFSTVLITKMAAESRQHMPPGSLPSDDVKSAALSFFAVMGIPQAVTFSVPYALAAIYSSESDVGHGLSLGLLNLAIMIPQIIVSLTSGFWDSLFGGGNLPSFTVGAVVAFISGIFALLLLPSTSSNT